MMGITQYLLSGSPDLRGYLQVLTKLISLRRVIIFQGKKTWARCKSPCQSSCPFRFSNENCQNRPAFIQCGWSALGFQKLEWLPLLLPVYFINTHKMSLHLISTVKRTCHVGTSFLGAPVTSSNPGPEI